MSLFLDNANSSTDYVRKVGTVVSNADFLSPNTALSRFRCKDPQYSLDCIIHSSVGLRTLQIILSVDIYMISADSADK